MANGIFYIIGGLSLFAALMAVTLRNLFHCALFFVLTMFCVAGVFLYLNAEFLAAVQVIIYVGAVTVFIFFGIMFTRNVMDHKINVMNRQFLIAFLIVGLFGWLAVKALEVSPFQGSNHPLVLTEQATLNAGGAKVTTVASAPKGDSASMDVEYLAEALLDPRNGYDYAFEFVSLLLLSALVGAIVIARKEPA
ncbi:MAG: NADH-quinone oxidoreductase subunit J family protein [bacterium]